MTALSPLLVSYRDPLGFEKIDLADILNGREGVWVEKPGTRTLARNAATFLDDPEETATFSKAHLTNRVEHQPPHFILSSRNAYIAGFRTIISRYGYWTFDQATLSASDEAKIVARRKQNPAECPSLVWNESEGCFVADFARKKVVALDHPVVLLTSNEPSNYGSFIFRVLPKLHQLHLFPAHYKFLLCATHRNCRDLAQLAGLPVDRVIWQDSNLIYHCQQVVVISNRNTSCCLDEESLRLFGVIREACLKSGPTNPASKLYVSRLSDNPRRARPMLNEEALIEALVQRGFHITNPERLDAISQVCLFGRASFIVGPSGSGMFNAVFSPPGTKIIDIESEPHWIHCHAGLFGSCGHQYGIFVGKPADSDWSQHHKPWSVNIPALLRRIELFDC